MVVVTHQGLQSFPVHLPRRSSIDDETQIIVHEQNGAILRHASTSFGGLWPRKGFPNGRPRGASVPDISYYSLGLLKDCLDDYGGGAGPEASHLCGYRPSRPPSSPASYLPSNPPREHAGDLRDSRIDQVRSAVGDGDIPARLSDCLGDTSAHGAHANHPDGSVFHEASSEHTRNNRGKGLKCVLPDAKTASPNPSMPRASEFSLRPTFSLCTPSCSTVAHVDTA